MNDQGIITLWISQLQVAVQEVCDRCSILFRLQLGGLVAIVRRMEDDDVTLMLTSYHVRQPVERRTSIASLDDDRRRLNQLILIAVEQIDNA